MVKLVHAKLIGIELKKNYFWRIAAHWTPKITQASDKKLQHSNKVTVWGSHIFNTLLYIL